MRNEREEITPDILKDEGVLIQVSTVARRGKSKLDQVSLRRVEIDRLTESVGRLSPQELVDSICFHLPELDPSSHMDKRRSEHD